MQSQSHVMMCRIILTRAKIRHLLEHKKKKYSLSNTVSFCDSYDSHKSNLSMQFAV